ncbi:hypothetical protein [Sphingobium herbicidovorans]|nr:hypothetical protein [Sphingobium herbicidovorans]
MTDVKIDKFALDDASPIWRMAYILAAMAVKCVGMERHEYA